VRDGGNEVRVSVRDAASAETGRIERALASLGANQETLGERAGRSRRSLGGRRLRGGFLLLSRSGLGASGRRSLRSGRGGSSGVGGGGSCLGGRRGGGRRLLDRTAADAGNGCNVHNGRSSGAGGGHSNGGNGGAAGPGLAASAGALPVTAQHALAGGVEGGTLLGSNGFRDGDGSRDRLGSSMAGSEHVVTVRIVLDVRARKDRGGQGGNGEGDGFREAEHGRRYVTTGKERWV
jgi:hypothetical protein